MFPPGLVPPRHPLRIRHPPRATKRALIRGASLAALPRGTARAGDSVTRRFIAARLELSLDRQGGESVDDPNPAASNRLQDPAHIRAAKNCVREQCGRQGMQPPLEERRVDELAHLNTNDRDAATRARHSVATQAYYRGPCSS